MAWNCCTFWRKREADRRAEWLLLRDFWLQVCFGGFVRDLACAQVGNATSSCAMKSRPCSLTVSRRGRWAAGNQEGVFELLQVIIGVCVCVLLGVVCLVCVCVCVCSVQCITRPSDMQPLLPRRLSPTPLVEELQQRWCKCWPVCFYIHHSTTAGGMEKPGSVIWKHTHTHTHTHTQSHTQ